MLWKNIKESKLYFAIAQNEGIPLIFLIFFYDLALRTFNTAYVAASMDLRK